MTWHRVHFLEFGVRPPSPLRIVASQSGTLPNCPRSQVNSPLLALLAPRPNPDGTPSALEPTFTLVTLVLGLPVHEGS